MDVQEQAEDGPPLGAPRAEVPKAGRQAEEPVRTHLTRWGWVWLMFALFLGSWAGQLAAMSANGTSDEFIAATLENWQSEWLQLTFQAVFLLGLGHVGFKAEKQDQERMERRQEELAVDLGWVEDKLDRVLEHLGIDYPGEDDEDGPEETA